MRTLISMSRLTWASAFLTILGAKLFLVNQFGSNVPFWDQWDAEAINLYNPYLNGTLHFGDLFAAHNEHRIFVTRVFNLILLEFNGLWFPRLQMVANALLHVAVLTGMVIVLGRQLPPISRLALAAFVALAFSLPFGWENTLAGFQSQFYFVFGFSFLAIMLTVSEKAFSLRWCLGFLALLVASVSMSSGVLAIFAIICVCALQMLLDERQRNSIEVIGLLVLFLAFLLIYQTVPVVEAHEILKASSIGEFVSALVTVAAWPIPFGLLAAVLLNLPIFTLLVITVLKRRAATRVVWLLLGTMAWVALQWVSFAYGRAEIATSSRYTDTLMIAVVVNFAAALYLATFTPARNWWAAVVYCLAVAVAITVFGLPAIQQARDRGNSYEVQIANMRAFYATQDLAAMKALPYFSLPYYDIDRLAMIANLPAIVSVLHPDVTGRPVTANLLLPHQVNWLFRAVQLSLLIAAPYLVAFGILSFIFSGFQILRCAIK